MEHRRRSKRSRGILWGLFLMTLGGVFLLDRLGFVALPSVWDLWPTVLVVIGVSHLFDGRPGSAATLTLMGLAFFAAEFHWMGFAYHSFWPLLLVAVGVGIVIAALSGEDDRREREEARHE